MGFTYMTIRPMFLWIFLMCIINGAMMSIVRPKFLPRMSPSLYPKELRELRL